MKRRFDGVAPWAKPAQGIPPGAGVETSTPTRTADFVADVAVPLLQAGITGGLVGAVVVLAIAGLAPDFSGDLLQVWAAAALLVATVAWVILLRQTRRLLWGIERLTGLDLDQDGAVGKPGHLVFVNRQKARQEAEKTRQDAEWRQFLGFVARLGVKGTTLAAWEGQIGRDNYQEWRDCLIDYGFAQWNSYRANGQPNTTQGWRLVTEPADILAQLTVDKG
jgi:hypothetical protein